MSEDSPLDSTALTEALNKVKESQPEPAYEEPDENEINQVIDMGFGRDEAVNALKKSNNNVARAVEYIFNGSLETTDEPQFQGMVFKEDEYMAKAMAESQQQQAPQVSGYYDSDFSEKAHTQLVPYHHDDISIGPVSLSSEQPTLRLKGKNEPALLVPLPDAPYIAPLLVIFHRIPAARKAFLNGGVDIIDDYGYDENWWNGTCIDLEDEFAAKGLHPSQAENSLLRFVIETQRIMAFLDGSSNRPFADLGDLIVWGAPKGLRLRLRDGNAAESVTPIGEFCKTFLSYWPEDGEFSRTFNTKVKVIDDDDDDDEDDDESLANLNSDPSKDAASSNESLQRICNLVCDVMPAIVSDLYEVVDDMIWPPPSVPQTYLYDISDIISLTLKRDDGKSGSGIELPIVWYPDRYSEPIVKYLTRIKEMCDSLSAEAQRKGQQRNQSTTIVGYEGRKIFATAVGHLDSRSSEDPTDEALARALKDLTNISEKFTSRKETLEQEIKQLQARTLELRSLFQAPVPDEIWQKHFPNEPKPDMRPYRLVGVILSPTEYFYYDTIPEDTSPSLIDMDDTFSDCTGWWKVGPGHQNEPVASRVSEEDVLATVKEGSQWYNWQEVTVFYANSNAMDFKKHWIPLSDGLQRFVARDTEQLSSALTNTELGSDEDISE